jgi:hypothetical protein
VRDSVEAAKAIRANIEAMLGETVAPLALRGHSEVGKTDVLSKELAESDVADSAPETEDTGDE